MDRRYRYLLAGVAGIALPAVVIIAVVLALALDSDGGEPGGARVRREATVPAAPPLVPPERFPLVTRAPVSRPVASMTANVQGTLEVDLQRGCVWLASETGRYAIVWPVGTTATLDPFTVHLDGIGGGGVAREGDQLRGGGGYLSYSHVSSLDAAGVLASCLDGQEIAVFNHYDPIEVTAAPEPTTAALAPPLPAPAGSAPFVLPTPWARGDQFPLLPPNGVWVVEAATGERTVLYESDGRLRGRLAPGIRFTPSGGAGVA